MSSQVTLPKRAKRAAGPDAASAAAAAEGELTACPYRCGAAFGGASLLAAHIGQCPQRAVLCQLCSSWLPLSGLPKHAAECPQRLQACPYAGCAALLEPPDFKPHLLSCSRRYEPEPAVGGAASGSRKRTAAEAAAGPTITAGEAAQLAAQLAELTAAVQRLERERQQNKQRLQQQLKEREDRFKLKVRGYTDLTYQIATALLPAGTRPGNAVMLFQTACGQGSELLVHTLVKRWQLRLEDVTEDRCLALRLICQSGHIDTLEYLCDNFPLEADHFRVVDGQALRLACQNGHLPIVRHLLEKAGLGPADVRSSNCKALRLACQHGHRRLVMHLVQEGGVTAEDIRAEENRALRVTCEYGHLDVVVYLVDNFKLTAADVRDQGCHALQLACQRGHLPVVSFLVEYFKLQREDCLTHNSRTLRWAAASGHYDVLRYLSAKLNLRKSDMPDAASVAYSDIRALIESLPE